MSGAPGSLGEEAARLAAAVQDWLRTVPGGEQHASRPDGEPGSAVPPECQVCPACQLLRLVRGTRPEASESGQVESVPGAKIHPVTTQEKRAQASSSRS